MDNLILIDSTNPSEIVEALADHDIESAHFSNGTYAYPKEMILGTTLGGFRYLADNYTEGDMIVAVNSDVSMEIILKQNIQNTEGKLNGKIDEMNRVSQEESFSEEMRAVFEKEIEELTEKRDDALKAYDNKESQTARAGKIAEDLAEQHPNRRLVVMFYDEETPTKLYDNLSDSGFGMLTLHKWGYGTDPNASRIEGAHNFDEVYAFPLPNDKKPVCYDLTVGEDQSDIVKVIKLTEQIKPSGQPYIQPLALG